MCGASGSNLVETIVQQPEINFNYCCTVKSKLPGPGVVA